MERKIGEIFEHNGEWYQCIIGHCNQCIFDEAGTCKVIGNPYCAYRNDKKLACFKKLEKVGEPYEFDGHLFQSYRTFEVPIFTENYATVRELGNNSKISIEIKQNKEDMEEKKLNLKPFDIQKAREGKPVCTRDGHKARIICFDYNGETGDYPIVALVHYNKGNKCYERVLKYTSDGLFNKYGDYQHDDDLMMLPEKHEGWVNVYKVLNGYEAGTIFETENEAKARINLGYIATVKIEWEE